VLASRAGGADADVCGDGLGIQDNSGAAIPLPSSGSALIVDVTRGVLQQNYVNGSVVVSTRGSDCRIGDPIGGSGDGNSRTTTINRPKWLI